MKPIFRVLLMSLFLIVLAACGSSTPDPTPEPTPIPTLEPTPTPHATAIPAPATRAEQSSQQAYIRIVQGSWDLPEVDVYVDGAVFGYNVRFGQVIEPQPLVNGTYTLRLIPSGLDINTNSEQVLFNHEFVLPVGETFTFIIGGEQSDLNIQVVSENMMPIELGSSRVTLIHALYQGEGLGVKVGEHVLIAPIEPYQISHEAPIQDLNSRAQIVTGAGDVIAEYDREFRSRVGVTLVAIGNASVPESVRLVNYTTRVYGESSVYFVNAIEEQPSVDIYLDGDLMAGGVINAQLHDKLTLKPADYQLEIFPSGAPYQPTDAIYRALINLYEDETSIITFARQNSRINHSVTLNVPSLTPAGQARIWFVHALYDDDPVNVVAGNISNVLYGGDVTRERYIDAGNYDLVSGYDESSNTRTLPLQVQAGNNYVVLYVARDSQPIVATFAVGEEQPQQFDDVSQQTEQPNFTTQTVTSEEPLVYVLNLVGGENVIDVAIGDYRVGGVPLGGMISGGNIAQGDYEIRALVAGTQNIFSLMNYSFRNDYFYTIYVTGLNIASPQIHVFEHGLIRDLFDENQAVAHFSNLSIFGSDDLMLALSESGVRLSPAVLTIEGAETPAEPIPNRYVVDGNYQVIHNNLRLGQITYPQYLVAGTYELILFDLVTGYGIVTLPNLNFQAGARYDVIIQQDITTEAISFSVVQYPAP